MVCAISAGLCKNGMAFYGIVYMKYALGQGADSKFDNLLSKNIDCEQ
jgi:hypothetical protein